MERLVLRLHDLPSGYLPFFPEDSDSEVTCAALDPVEPQPALARFIKRFTPEGCIVAYLRGYRVSRGPSAQMVGTGALDAGSIAAAKAGFALAPQILSQITAGEIPTEIATDATIGDATRLFHWLRVPSLYGKGPWTGSFLAWRSGDVLATVFASSGSLETSDRFVEELARRQQAHIEQPTPYTRAERNSSEVGLDDPALKLPVYWLGRNFKPGHGLPIARLEWGAVSRYYPDKLPHQELQVGYSKELGLSSWTKAGWRRFLATPDGREIFAERCLTSTDVAVGGGRATIYTGHVAGFGPCATASPRRFFAVVHLGGIVVGVRLSSCRDCIELARGSYNSLAGMTAVVRSLRLRPPPEY